MKWSKSFTSQALPIAVSCSMLAPLNGISSAQPLYVSVSSAQYLTYVEVFQATNFSNNMGNYESRTTISPSPISDEIDLPIIIGQGQGTITHAIANAGLFDVSDQSGWGFANAEGVSQLWFSPLADQNQALSFQITAYGPGSQAFTAGQASLLDLTSSSELWNYTWNAIGDTSQYPVSIPLGLGNIPWVAPDFESANFSVTSKLLASDQYELTMIVCSNAGDDLENAEIQLVGLQVVPEPPSFGLFAMCSFSLLLSRPK